MIPGMTFSSLRRQLDSKVFNSTDPDSQEYHSGDQVPILLIIFVVENKGKVKETY